MTIQVDGPARFQAGWKPESTKSGYSGTVRPCLPALSAVSGVSAAPAADSPDMSGSAGEDEPRGLRGLSRRSFLSNCGAAAATAAFGLAGLASLATPALAAAPDPSRPGSPLDALTPVIHPVLELRNANTQERWSGTYFSWNDNAYSATAIRELNWFFRDWRESLSVVMDPRLYWALSALSQGAQADGHSGAITVTSGYRTRKTNSHLEGAAPNSFHLRGRAVDLGIAGVSTKQISDYMVWLQVGGVGHYPGRFVHIDTGRVRTW